MTEDNEDEIRKLAYQIAQQRLKDRPGPFGALSPLPHRMDVEAAMDEARARFAEQE
jgi:hypothetical protein